MSDMDVLLGKMDLLKRESTQIYIATKEAFQNLRISKASFDNWRALLARDEEKRREIAKLQAEIDRLESLEQTDEAQSEYDRLRELKEMHEHLDRVSTIGQDGV